MRETWYVLEDGMVADPKEVAPDDRGVLRHSSGVAVAMRGDVPHSRGVDDAEAERARGGTERRRRDAVEGAKDMKPEESKRGYRTRDVKAGSAESGQA